MTIMLYPMIGICSMILGKETMTISLDRQAQPALQPGVPSRETVANRQQIEATSTAAPAAQVTRVTLRSAQAATPATDALCYRMDGQCGRQPASLPVAAEAGMNRSRRNADDDQTGSLSMDKLLDAVAELINNPLGEFLEHVAVTGGGSQKQVERAKNLGTQLSETLQLLTTPAPEGAAMSSASSTSRRIGAPMQHADSGSSNSVPPKIAQAFLDFLQAVKTSGNTTGYINAQS